MTTQAKWAFALIGNDKTGKTTFQKHLVRLLTGCVYNRLDCDLTFDITHPNIIRKIKTISFRNRSIQETMGAGADPYTSIDEYFKKHVPNADICVSSTHLDQTDAQAIISNLHRRYYNVCAVFFSNSITSDPSVNADISELNWDDRWQVSNDDSEQWEHQLERAAESFVQMLIERTRGW